MSRCIETKGLPFNETQAHSPPAQPATYRPVAAFVNSKCACCGSTDSQHSTIGITLETRPSAELGDDGNGRRQKAGGARHTNGKEDDGARGVRQASHTCLIPRAATEPRTTVGYDPRVPGACWHMHARRPKCGASLSSGGSAQLDFARPRTGTQVMRRGTAMGRCRAAVSTRATSARADTCTGGQAHRNGSRVCAPRRVACQNHVGILDHRLAPPLAGIM